MSKSVRCPVRELIEKKNVPMKIVKFIMQSPHLGRQETSGNCLNLKKPEMTFSLNVFVALNSNGKTNYGSRTE